MGVVKKENIRDYWSMDSIIETPFVRTVMSRNFFQTILTFFHLADNDIYPKGSDDYDPREKLGYLFTSLSSSFTVMWIPRQNLSIDEGCIAFKGNISFKYYNPKKIDKYHIKSYKVVDSSNNYCLRFDLYVGQLNENVSEFGKTHDLVFRMCSPYFGHSYVIHMDNWYTSPIIFYNLHNVQTGACGTVKQNRIGLPREYAKLQVKKKGDKLVYSYDNQMQVIKIFDRKPVSILSTVYDGEDNDTGKRHWQTKEVIRNMMIGYNKYMGGADANDQLLQYSWYRHKSLKWWKKVAFRLLNIAMVNSYCMYKEWFAVRYPTKHAKKQTDFRVAVIKQLLATCNQERTHHHVSRNVADVTRLSGRHFIHKIPTDGKKKGSKSVCCLCPWREENKQKYRDQ